MVSQLANRAIYIGEHGEHKKHPLEFVCDCVSVGKITSSIGLGMIGLFIENGSRVNGFSEWKEDIPLLSAIGYYLEDIAHFLIDKGADYTHVGHHGATALHWAAWTGQDSLVSALLEFPVDIDAADHDFGATPLLYGIHGYFRGGEINDNNQLNCIQLLLNAGANPRHKDKEGNDAWGYLKGREGSKILAILDK
jgi:ankyrin repeat protein